MKKKIELNGGIKSLEIEEVPGNPDIKKIYIDGVMYVVSSDTAAQIHSHIKIGIELAYELYRS